MEIFKKIEMLIIAIRCFFQGDSWKDAVWYAESIVYGWKEKKEDNKKN